KVAVEVQIVITGEAAVDTLVTQEMNTIEVEADVSSIPEQVEVSVEGLAAGTQIHASDVPLPEGTTLRADGELLVVNVVAAPTAAEVEASMDTEGAGVIEEPSTADAADAAD